MGASLATAGKAFTFIKAVIKVRLAWHVDNSSEFSPLVDQCGASRRASPHYQLPILRCGNTTLHYIDVDNHLMLHPYLDAGLAHITSYLY